MGSKSVSKSEKRRSSSSRYSVNGSHSGAAHRFIRPAKLSSPATHSSLHPLLTPLSRLKRFQKQRDRNLGRKKGARTSLVKRVSAMEVLEQQTQPVIAEEVHEPVTNGLNGDTNQTNGPDSPPPERRRTPRKEKQEVRVNGDSTAKAEEEEEEEEVEVEVVAVSDKEEELIDEQPLKILRRSLRHSPKRSMSPKEKAKPRSSPAENDMSDYLAEHPELLSREFRISGRRGIKPSPLGKRKSDVEDPPAKRAALETPSVSSPGWKFFSSPFTRLWPSTPGRPGHRPEDDSLFVNVSTDSESSLSGPVLNSEPAETTQTLSASQSSESESPPSKSWLCSVM